jgi:hypothetical protein
MIPVATPGLKTSLKRSTGCEKSVAFEQQRDGEKFSLSPRERAGVRGKRATSKLMRAIV